jgi:hypothetical protein
MQADVFQRELFITVATAIGSFARYTNYTVGLYDLYVGWLYNASGDINTS